jgi:lantibiotic transport system permease protein
MFLRVLLTECLKLKRTLALWMVFVSPLVLVLLQFAVTYKRSASFLKGSQDAWPFMVHQTIEVWALLLMPMFITLETSLLAGLENAEKNWKSLLALPAPRWTVYASKLALTIAMLWAAHVILIGGTLVGVLLLKALVPALSFGGMPLSPFVVPMLRVSGAALLGVVIQHWVSLRWQSYTAAMGFGICAMIIGVFAAQSAEIGSWFPWSLPIHAVLDGAAGRDRITFWSIGGATIAAALGCWEFVKREIV